MMCWGSNVHLFFHSHWRQASLDWHLIMLDVKYDMNTWEWFRWWCGHRHVVKYEAEVKHATKSGASWFFAGRHDFLSIFSNILCPGPVCLRRILDVTLTLCPIVPANNPLTATAINMHMHTKTPPQAAQSNHKKRQRDSWEQSTTTDTITIYHQGRYV